MTTTQRDYYEVLGVTRGADAGEIKSAFRSLARELHPDVSESPDAEREFRDLAEAYSVLSKRETRFLYDRFGYRGRGHGGFDAARPEGLDDLFETWFTVPGKTRGRDVSIKLELDPFEAQRATRQTVSFQAATLCSACDGAGVAPGAVVETCGACQGSGRRRNVSELKSGRWLDVESCPDCGGDGQIVSAVCTPCGGEGRLELERTLRIRIPAGVTNGQRLRLAAEGEPGDKGGEPGDLFVELTVPAPPADPRVVRYAAAAGFLASVGFLLLLLFR